MSAISAETFSLKPKLGWPVRVVSMLIATGSQISGTQKNEISSEIREFRRVNKRIWLLEEREIVGKLLRVGYNL